MGFGTKTLTICVNAERFFKQVEDSFGRVTLTKIKRKK